jgi:LPS export ABC transporter protein LptC
MKRSEAANYARWSALVACLLASLTAGVYVQRAWVEHREKKKAPPPAPRDVTKLTSGITFSKVAGKQKIFTLEASKSTDFKDKDASLLEEVKITIFGKIGERHDVIRTHSCQYGKATGSIVCSGEVQIDMQSAADAERDTKSPGVAGARLVHVETRGVTFDRGSGTARTDQPVKFVFPNGTGHAVGVEYKSEEGTIQLLNDVKLMVIPTADHAARKQATKAAPQQPVLVKGTSLEFGRETRAMHLLGPAEVETSTARLTAGEITLRLDAAFHAERLFAAAGANGTRPELASLGTRALEDLSADTVTARFAPEGWVTEVAAAGSVRGSRQLDTERDELSAEKAALNVWPMVSQPKELNLNGAVVLETRAARTGETRVLQTSALRVEFTEWAEGHASKPRKAESLSHGILEWTEAGTPTGGVAAKMKLQSDKLEMEFEPAGVAKQLRATGNVQTERTAALRPVQTATAQSGVAELRESGGWTQFDLQGGVQLKEGERSGQADHAVLRRAEQTALLTGQAMARDAATETHAERISFAQTTGEIRAEGGVRSTDFSARGSAVQFAMVPPNITSDTLEGNSKTGRALYSGHARLWQGDSVLEADSIELLREARVVNAVGNVRAVFPQVASRTPSQVLGVQRATMNRSLWHATAGTLTYRDTENRAHLEKNVVVQSVEQRTRSAALDLYFTSGTSGGAPAALDANMVRAGGGPQQISRAVGTGGVIVEQGARKATAERGEYTATDGKFVMSGGNPALYDANEGTTTGRRLTFFLADDTIIVDSENGSRTLTRHRVEK